MQKDAIHLKIQHKKEKTNFYGHYEIECECDSAEKIYSAMTKFSKRLNVSNI